MTLADVTAAPAPGAPPQASVVVLDTSVLLADPDSIFSFGDADVVVPLTVIEELDGHKGRYDEVGRAARSSARLLEELRTASPGRDLRTPVPLPGGGTLRVVINGQRLDALAHLGLDTAESDNRILAAALGLTEPDAGPAPRVTLISADINLRLKAAALGLEADEYTQTRPGWRSEAHPGWRSIAAEGPVVDRLYAEHRIPLAEVPSLALLAPNEFAVLGAGSQSALVRRRGASVTLVPTRLEAWGARPRSKEQRFALDLLLDPEVPIVGLSGRAGTGKTMLAVAAGLEQVFEPANRRYDQLVIIRPMTAVGRQEVGFLPGDLAEKLAPWFTTVEDTMTALREDHSRTEARSQLEAWVDGGQVDMQPITYLRGRSLHRSFILVDEAQNLEAPLTLKTILTRLGEGSKVVFVGDLSQIDSPFVSERTSALAVLADRFSGSELFGHLVLTQGERSAVADLAAELL